jgi:hypothetical protein
MGETTARIDNALAYAGFSGAQYSEEVQMRTQVKEAFVRVCLVAIAAILVASVALAQTDRGTITGTLADSTGAVVPGASVQVTNTETGAQYDTVTTGTGNYTLASLVAGNYNLTVAVTGFKKFTQEGIQVTVAQTARVDVTLEVGAISDAVTITADAPLLKTENNASTRFRCLRCTCATR